VRGSYNNLGQCIAGVVKQGGMCKLYTGFLASVAVSGPSSAVFIACYECSKNAIEKVAATFPPPLASIQNIAPILAAAFGNLAASTVRVPPEVIKQRVQAGLYRDVLQAIKAIWVNEGFSGFYCGYSLQVNSLILINQKVSCGLELDLHVGLSKSIEIYAKLLIWLTDSECR
jgi:hypothetical protein